MYISEAENRLSSHYLSRCGLFEDILQQMPVSAERTGGAGNGEGRTENTFICFAIAEKGQESR